MKEILKNPYLHLAARSIVGFMFIIVAVSKISHPATFSNEIANYGIMPMFTVNLMALILPWIELIAGILLLAGVRIKTNSAIIGGLLIVFILGVLSAMVRGLDIDCGCYGSMGALKVGWEKVSENTVLLILTAYTYFVPQSKFTLDYITQSEQIQA